MGDDGRRGADLAAIEAWRTWPWSTAAEDAASVEAGRGHNERTRTQGDAAAPKSKTPGRQAADLLRGR